MAKIKHIAIATQDADKTARFYIDVMGLKEAGKIDSANASGYYLTDGNINMAILNFKNDQVAGPEYGTGYSGIHHIGFEVEDLEEVSGRLEEAGSKPREEINKALGVGMDGPRHANVEVKYGGPDGVIIDVSQTGWVGTGGLGVIARARVLLKSDDGCGAPQVAEALDVALSTVYRSSSALPKRGLEGFCGTAPRRLEFHYTPKHGSWLNMAEIEFSVLSRSCLKQRLPSGEALSREIDAMVRERNDARAAVNWRFSTQDARHEIRASILPILRSPEH